MGNQDSRQEIAALVKEQTDIVKVIEEHVDLKRSGVRYLGLCPFHGEKTPSFSVHGAQQFYHCFGCKESGDVYSFVMKYHNMDFPQALKFLADRLNIQLPEKTLSPMARKREEEKEKLYTVSNKAAAIYHRVLMEDEWGAAARRYLENRGIPKDIQIRFGLGCAPEKELAGWEFLGAKFSAEEKAFAEDVGLLVKNDRGGRYDRFRNRILFPIHDMRGRVCGFGGRIISDGQPKYMNSPESVIYNKSQLLLGLYQQREQIQRKRQAIVVEGNFDMISLVVHGLDNVVAPLGTALTSAQIRLLKRYAEEVILLFDGDAAGIKAAIRSAPLFLAENLDVRVALLPQEHDPDSYIRAMGKDAMAGLVAKGEPLAEFMLAQLVDEFGLSLDGKRKIAERLKDLVDVTGSPLQRSVIISHFAEKLGVEAQYFEHLMKGEISAAPVREERKVRADMPVSQITAAQKRLVEFMVLNPHHIAELERCGVRDVLQGSVGEVIYLQVRALSENAPDMQPEDILPLLPEGAERQLVSDTLLSAWQTSSAVHNEELTRQELAELCEWLEFTGMRMRSKVLDGEIAAAQRNNDFELLDKILREKMLLEQKMHS